MWTSKLTAKLDTQNCAKGLIIRGEELVVGRKDGHFAGLNSNYLVTWAGISLLTAVFDDRAPRNLAIADMTFTVV